MKKVLLFVAALFSACALSAQITINVEVPTGTPSCSFYGALSENKFVDMTKVDATHYTITFSDKTAADLGWGYKFCWENGNWNTQVSPDTTYDTVDGTTVVVPGWQTQPGATYDYPSYTEWNYKSDATGWEWTSMTKQGNVWIAQTLVPASGVNIGSCSDCPISKDWFPVSDVDIEAGLSAGDNAYLVMTIVDSKTASLAIKSTVAADEAQADEAAIVAVYNLAGQATTLDAAGVKIVVYANGTSKKIQ